MIKDVAIVGAGINGLLSAFLITESYPQLKVNIYDAEKNPSTNTLHKGVTYNSRDARHITGSESIGYESSIHKDALRNTPTNVVAGWLLKDENHLTQKEKQWRQIFETSYIGSSDLNALDFAHAKLNYKGLALWQELAQKYPFIARHVISNQGVDVYFTNETDFNQDLIMEKEFCQRYFKKGTVQVNQNRELERLYHKKITVPGISIRVRSLALALLDRLESNKNVRLHWNNAVISGDRLESLLIIWTAGVTHAQPAEYTEHYVQGIVGCWLTLPNKNYDRPFKIASPPPSAYINFTPDAGQLHISGGFGWTGEYTELSTVNEMAVPLAEHFVEQINQYLGTNITSDKVDFCVRPSTPTGQPLQLSKSLNGKLNIYITGSAKSGTTHAPALSEYVLKEIKNCYN